MITEQDELRIRSFVNDFKRREKELIDFRITHDILVAKSFLNSFSQVERMALKLIENEAPKFNLFDIISINHLEAKVHTPFLVELLRPDGSHRQNRLFFDAFFSHLFPTIDTRSVSDIRVSKEVSDYRNGRMDILIRYQEKGLTKALVIENKIYHHDEEEQLKRYYNYLTGTLNLKDGYYHLVYLTPYKTRPTVKSIPEELYLSLKDKKSITEWGYYNDVTPILESVLKFIKAPVVLHTLLQYTESIQSL